MSPTVFMFSGQGSHYYQMGSELFLREPVFKRWMLELDVIAVEMLGLSIVDLLYHQQKTKADVFDRTRLTSPAIFMVEYALAQTLMDRGLQPDLLVAASLGVFTAACVAGSIEPQQALRVVIEKSMIIEAHCPPGAMLAVLASTDKLSGQRELSEYAELASVNSSTHFVLAVNQENLPKVQALLQTEHLTFQALAVSYAFHSRWIEQAHQPCLELFQTLRPQRPRLPVVCSTQAAPLADITAALLWDAVRKPIRLAETIRALEAQNAYRYIDVGPGSTLATQLKYIISPASQSAIHSILSPFSSEHKNYSRLLNALHA